MSMKLCVLFSFGFFLMVIPAHSDATYITDDIRVMLRSDAGTDRRIIAMPKSGTRVEVLKETEDGWSKVRLPDGKEGWLLTRYLSAGPPTKEVNARLKSENEVLRQKAKTLTEENARLKREKNKLQKALSKHTKTAKTPEKSYATLKKGSSDILALKASHDKSSENQTTKAKPQAQLEEKHRSLQGKEHYDFRKTKWGMTIAQVKSSEPLDVAKEDKTLLGYKTIVIGKDVIVGYFFIDNQLVRARYVLAESHSNKTDFIIDYNDFKKILTKKYGKPKEEKSLWKNELYKDDYSHWGMAISMGHLVYFSSWETQDTEISVILMGENFDISCIVEYSSKGLKEIEKKAQEKKALDAF